jgi:hypothetical protein
MDSEFDELMASNLKTENDLGLWRIEHRKQQADYCGEIFVMRRWR